MNVIKCFVVAGLGAVLAAAARGESTLTTDPVGFVRVQTPAAAEAVVACPFERPWEFYGKVVSVAGGVVTVAGRPAWPAGRFVFATPAQPKTYYVRFVSGARAGAFFTVLSNGADTLVLDLNGDTLAQVVAGDLLTVNPYWTIGALFPASAAGVSFESSPSAVSRRTELLFPDQSAVGTNPSAAATYYFLNGAWRRFGAPITESFDDAVILPDSYVLVRNRAFSGVSMFVGSVLMSDIRIGLNSRTTAKQDNIVALTRPIDVSLANSGLISSGAFRATLSPAARLDELFVFDNTAPGINKSAAAIYYYYNGAWRKFGRPITEDCGAELAFKAGQGAIIRKAETGVPAATTDWVNQPTY